MVFFRLLFLLLFCLCSLKSDSSDFSALWFIEMYCWKCTGQGFLPTLAGSSHLSSLFPLCGFLPLYFRLAILQHWQGGSLLLYLLAIGVCACVRVSEHAGEAADAGSDDRDDE